MKITLVDSKTKFRYRVVLIWLFFVLFGGIWMVWHNSAKMGENLDFLWSLFAWVIIIKLLTSFINALKFKSLSRIFNLRLTVKEWIGLSVIPTFYSYFIPAQLGHLPRAWYLKRIHGFNYADYTSLITGMNVFGILISSLTGIIVTLVALSDLQENGKFIFLACISAFMVGIVLCLVFFMICRFHLQLPINRINQFAINFRNGLKTFEKDKKRLAELMVYQFFTRIATGTGLYFSFLALGFHYPFCLILVMECLVSIMTVITLTPGNIGIREGGIAGIAALAGISINNAILSSILSRLGSVFIHFVLGVIFSYLLLGHPFFRVENNKIDKKNIEL